MHVTQEHRASVLARKREGQGHVACREHLLPMGRHSLAMCALLCSLSRYCVAFDGSEIAQEHAYYLKYQNLRSVRTSHAHFVHAHA